MNFRIIITICLVILTTPAPAHAAQTVWQIADRIEVDNVPSWFPVGFSLLTHSKRQYIAYYDADHQMIVAVRTLGDKTWQKHKLPSKVGWDSHNYITMAVDSAGHLHLSGNMHCVPLIYFRTTKPGDITTFKRLPMTGQNEKRCTYPRFVSDADGRLVFTYRDGGSGNGRRFYNVYDPARQQWSRLFESPLFEGQGKRNAYPLGPVVGPDNLFHVIWVWRDTPDCATNHNLSYVRSRDLVNWQTAAGKPVELPMMLETQGLIVDPAASRTGMINGGQKLVFAANNRPMIAYHKNDANGHMQLYVARFDGSKWVRHIITDWNKPVPFSGGGAMPFIGIRLSTPKKVQGDIWAVSYRHKDYGSGKIYFSEKTLLPTNNKFPKRKPELPAELSRPEIKFKSIGIRQAGDLGTPPSKNIRYIMKWDVLPANYDRKRTGPLPPPAKLRVYKLTSGPRQF